ncbi:MAG: hypothetical protein U5K69_04495 [Balneolaceae bacterium]|nr:hypothetical protein [Balneolaceae bacterium]
MAPYRTAFWQALADVDRPRKFKMEFIGNAHPSLQKWVDKLELNHQVKLKSYVPHDEAIRAMCTADLLLLSISKTPGSELILTGKLFEYLGSAGQSCSSVQRMVMLPK